MKALKSTVFALIGLTVFAIAGCKEQPKTIEVELVTVDALPDLHIYYWSGHYYSLVQTSVDWDEAERRCEKMGGHLATVTSADEEKAIFKVYNHEGFNSQRWPDAWLGAENVSSTDGSYRWVTGEDFSSYSHWCNKEPSGGAEHYLMYYTPTNYIAWNDAKKDNKYSYICEWEGDFTFGERKPLYAVLDKHEIRDLPGLNVYKVGEHFYSLIREEMNWKNAEKRAEDIGGHLITITSREEDQILYKICFNEELSTSMNVWMGMVRDNENNFIWVTGEDIGYTNWNTNQPDNSQNIENVAHYISSTELLNKWNDRPSSGVLPALLVEWEDATSFNKSKPLYIYETVSNQRELMEALNKNDDKIILLTQDIRLDENFVPVDSFRGILDGNNHNITMRSRVAKYESVNNFIGELTGEIRNLSLSYRVETSDVFDGFGGLVVTNKGRIENVKTDGYFVGNRINYVGGIAAYNKDSGVIINCENSVTITAKDYVGGVVGQSFGNKTYYGCKNKNGISGRNYIGGVVGYHQDGSLTIEKCENSGEIGAEQYLAGLVGYANSASAAVNVNHSSNKGDIAGDYYVGGIFGFAQSSNGAYGDINTSSSSGSLKALAYCGAIAGKLTWIKINGCENTNTIFYLKEAGLDGNGNKISFIGGYVGYGFCVNECVNKSSISAPGPYVGGIAGYLLGDGVDCKNYGNITGDSNNVGGLFGTINTPDYTWLVNVENCENYGDVSGTGSVGGIYGAISLYSHSDRWVSKASKFITITNLLNAGNITGKEHVGGIGGYTSVSYHCHDEWGYGNYYWGALIGTRLQNKGNVTGEATVGAIFGYAKTDRSDSYVIYLTNTRTDIPLFGQLVNISNRDE